MLHDPHIPDEDLLQLMDGELARTRSQEVEAHLLRCWRCRSRRGELEQSISEFVRFQRVEFDSRIPDISGPAAQLHARLDTLANEPQRQRTHFFGLRWASVPTAIAASAVVLGVVLLSWPLSRSASAASLPNSKLTPGATREISKEQVCALPGEDEERQVPTDLAIHVFQEYGIHQPRPRAYEMDYLITPALGGAEDVRNLWPQPYSGSVWTAHVKDALEDHLRTLVCKGEIDLATAQHEMASNWIAAYQKYFQTRRPLASHISFTKDLPWE